MAFKVLLIHQNFPGQFKFIAQALATSTRFSNTVVVALGAEAQGLSFADSISQKQRFNYIRYKYLRSNDPNIHPWLQDLDSKVIRGESCASACKQLKDSGFVPDIIIHHSGWGEGLFLQLIFPCVPIVAYQEFFYQPNGGDFDFDPEFQNNHQWHDYAKLQLKQASQLLSLHQATWNICPTEYQRSTFPRYYQDSFSVIHDGIDIASIDAIGASPLEPNDICELNLDDGTPLVTCVMRSIEPYRGCHTLIRAIPAMQKMADSRAQIIIVGNIYDVSYGPKCPTGNWKEHFLAEIHGRYDPSRVHFVGRIPYSKLIRLLHRSNAHIYLTYPFVLSWSLLEAMACGCAIVGSNTAPVREVITDRTTGLLTDFFDPHQLAEQVVRLLEDNELASRLGSNARKLIMDKYSLHQCLTQQVALIDLVAGGVLKQL